MSNVANQLAPLTFPLHGSRLIEASAGTGKTWTIAALYVRLVLGHGGDDAYRRPLLPADILVMTFTRAATRELSNRVRERLVEAAAYFREAAPHANPDDYLDQILESYPDYAAQQQAAHRLQLAAETMDEAAIFTIDAWCQRMLREHAFDSGSLFDEELVSDEQALFEDAAHDYWRQQVYPLNAVSLDALLSCWSDVGALKFSIRELVKRADIIGQASGDSLGVLIANVQREQQAQLAELKAGWYERANRMEQWIAQLRAADPKCLNGNKMRPDSLVAWFNGLREWAQNPVSVRPDISDTAWNRLTTEGVEDAFAKNFSTVVPEDFEATLPLKFALAEIAPLSHALYRHAAAAVAARMAELKKRSRQFGFADMLDRLNAALQGENGAALRKRITDQYPVALVDEFQDTAPNQYQIFNALYRVADNDPQTGLFLIGDPKQSIYGFRGADIHSYLSARRATAGRHYQLGTNYRSTRPVVDAVNHLFLNAEGRGDGDGFARGAFRFRDPATRDNPLPFEAVGAKGRKERMVGADGDVPALVIACSAAQDLKADSYREFFAHYCAEDIVARLNDERTGFQGDTFERLKPADIAVLVRDRKEAAAIRRALQRRGVPSVYLSDKDSVTDSEEAADVLRWLSAVANPLDGALARAAFATRTAGLPLAELARLSSDELAWEERVEQLKALHIIWQRQGVLAMLRRFIHELQLPAALLQQVGGERRLTNLLHLAELLQSASRQLDGEQALIRWLAEQIEGGEGAGDERVLRLESDAELVKVVTVHKSKGLEYPLVYLPFAVTARKVERRNRSFFEFSDDDGVRQIDMALTDTAMELVEKARLQEDLRLMYVALTRARHFLWLGVTALSARKAGDNTLHESALGYLLTGGAALPSDLMLERWQHTCKDCTDISIATLAMDARQVTRLSRVEHRPPLLEPQHYSGHFERDWSVGSFSSLARRTGPTGIISAAGPVPRDAQQEKLLEDDGQPAMVVPSRVEDTPWHRFPRGSVPGNFLHEQLEWMGQEGFDIVSHEHFETRLTRRVERAGWGNRLDDTLAWLREIANTPLPHVNAPLSAIAAPLPEMEFWFPSERLATGALDQLCAKHLLGGAARPALPERQLHGMLKGFCDLVFEHQGRYWILDYKSNALGGGDAAYHEPALVAAMADHRYDIQGAIYMLALHRLLQSRLGDAYDPATQLGGAIFMFLRGIGNPQTRGCYWIAPDPDLLDGLDSLLGATNES
ncbi:MULTISPECIES: exodeoxyribonuclease V subunit beta [unclassified Duganella]|uniref:exodeoxyribonuclease V subunit beta n=1 Tax=unclassified Duganella TaxID=2636909 RepID=UPI0008811917|nr:MULTISPECIES: exodeoxyribonuclease V subunit beta [unclassified Duganella]SDF67112.1 DNA helicase/exodeoxyribonuclease V, beta subunit [Duganella sp. OV458]SDI61881.1 DNA helicase/exodeoxyribonuclease V, beta subunit [Duganella sp. OV510]